MLYEDTVDDPPWDLQVKRRAINRAIRSSWPYFKVAAYDATTLLVAGAYAYALTTAGFADMKDMGGYAVIQVFLEPDSGDPLDWRPLRRVTQDCFAGTPAASPQWRIHVPPDVVDRHAGRHLRVHFYESAPELTWTGSDTLDARYCNYAVYRAAWDLISRFLQGGSDYNTDLYVPLWQEYEKVWNREQHDNLDYQMPCMVGVRAEGKG